MLESGHFIGDYQIVTPLAEHQLYTTYLAKKGTGEQVNLLLIAAERLAAGDIRRNFLKQVKLLQGQAFAGLNSLLHGDFDEDYAYLVFPCPSGTPLIDVLGVSYSARDALELFKQLVDSLIPAHEAGFWHGNITPAAVFVAAGRASLDQFSLTSILPLDLNTGIDPRYCSPELVRGERPGPATDLYNLGILFYLLLRGEVPFSGEDAFATAMQHLQKQAPQLPAEFAFCQLVIDGLLQVLPGDRLTITTLAADIEKLLALPGIDQPVQFEHPRPALEPQATAEPDPESSIEQLMTNSDMATRIEERLAKRADALKETGELTPDAKRASSARLTSIGRKIYQETQAQNMNQGHYRQNNGASRLLVLVAVGIIVGAVLYFLFFGQPAKAPQAESRFPAELLSGLDLGSKQLVAGDTEAAEKVFLELATDFPLFPQPYNNLAAIYARQGDLERSRTSLEKALATDESYVIVYRNLGTVYAEMARDSYVRALQMEKGEQAVALQVFAGDKLLAGSAAISAQVIQPLTKPPVVVSQQERNSIESAGAHNTGSDSPAAVELQATMNTDQVVSTAVELPAAITVVETVLEVDLQPVAETAEAYLQRWAEAWSAQAVEDYLAFYAADFVPAGGKSQADWEQRRRSRLTGPKRINVTLENFSMGSQADELLQVEVTQNYRSDRYTDRTRKLFTLKQIDNNWTIVRERSLGRAR